MAILFCLFFKQKTAYEMRISDWSSDVCSSDLVMGQPQYMLILAGEHTGTIARDGWTKARIREFVFARTQNSHAHLKRTHRMSGELQPGDETRMRPLVESHDDIFVVAAGGRGGAFSAYIPGWGSKRSSRAVTKEEIGRAHV